MVAADLVNPGIETVILIALPEAVSRLMTTATGAVVGGISMEAAAGVFEIRFKQYR